MVIDGNAVVHRAFHALRQELTTSRGELTNAVYGFTAILLKALQTEQPAYWAISFDLAAPTFRHQSFAAYKVHRPSMPEPLAPSVTTPGLTPPLTSPTAPGVPAPGRRGRPPA